MVRHKLQDKYNTTARGKPCAMLHPATRAVRVNCKVSFDQSNSEYSLCLSRIGTDATYERNKKGDNKNDRETLELQLMLQGCHGTTAQNQEPTAII